MNQIELDQDAVLGPYWRTLSPRVRGEILTSNVDISTLGTLKRAAEWFTRQEEMEKEQDEKR